MAAWLRRFFNVRTGEGRRTALLYTLAFLLILGSVWGETAAKALFIDNVGLDSYSILFIAEAVFTLTFTLVYTAFVDRVTNARLLAAICAVTSGALLVTGLMLAPGLPLAFYLFYLIGRATRVIFAVHVWTYIGDFYDTRAARRVFPLIGSSGRIAGVLGGLIFPLVVGMVGTQNVPYVWALVLFAGLWLTLSIPHWSGNVAPSASAPGRMVGVLENFRGGWRTIRGSHLLQLLAISATAMTALLALLNFQADYVFSRSYDSADELASLFGILTGLANVIALPFQLFLLARIVNRVGVGWSNFIYPMLAVGSFGLLGAFSVLPLAIIAYFVRTGFLSGVRNPLDNMLYNAVPRVVKGRARAFANALLVPVATFLAGVTLLLVPRGGALPWYLFALGGAVGLVYLFASWRIRSAYREALLETLAAEDDTAIYQWAGADWDAADRAALDRVLARLHESRDAGTTIFLAQLAYEIGGRDALPTLGKIAAERGPSVRAAILEIVGAAGLSDPRVRQLCTNGLTDADPNVRRAALAVLEEQSGPEDLPLLAQALDLLRDPDPDVRTRAISLLLRSGDFYYLTEAAGVLKELLVSDVPALRALALPVLGELGDPRVVRTLAPYLSDPVESVRRAAAHATAAVASPTAPPWVRQLTLEAAQQALSDPTEAIRLAGVQVLARLDAASARSALLEALKDDSLRVRDNARQVLESMGDKALKDLEALSATQDGRVRGAAIVALLHLAAEQYRFRADVEIQDTLKRAYHNLLLMGALSSVNLTGTALAVRTLDECNRELLDRVFSFLSALHGRGAVVMIQHNLQSPDGRARANAVEALEALTSPLVARLATPLAASQAVAIDGDSADTGVNLPDLIVLAQEELDLEPVTPEAALEAILTDRDPWVTAVGLYLTDQANQDLLDSPKLISIARRNEALTVAMGSSDRVVIETARHIASQSRLRRTGKEVSTMLSTIEKVIFLEEIPFFDGMTVTQLRSLAGIAEELHFDDDVIFREGEMGDTLYVVVSGRVGIERTGGDEGEDESVARVVTLESRQYFGETSIFNPAPHSATAIAIGQTLLLSISREPLMALVGGDPTLALELIRVLSQRLREANQQLVRITKAKPRRLHRLYDQLT